MSGFELSPVFVFVLVILASARMFRLLAYDTITQRLRDYLEVYVFARWPVLREGWLCPACLGYWVALGWTITALAWHANLVWQLAALSFAANYAGMILNGLYDVEHAVAEGDDD